MFISIYFDDLRSAVWPVMTVFIQKRFPFADIRVVK
jgi:hypothetical protein